MHSVTVAVFKSWIIYWVLRKL